MRIQALMQKNPQKVPFYVSVFMDAFKKKYIFVNFIKHREKEKKTEIAFST